MTSILALDLATQIGWAHWQPGMTKPRAGHHRLPKTGDDVGWFLDAYDEWLASLLTACKPGILCFEAPWVGGKTHQATARKLMNMAGHTEFQCRRLQGIRYFEANIPEVRKHFCGRGTVVRGDRNRRISARDIMKQLIKDECDARGWSYANDDEADALAILDFAIAQIKTVTPPWRTGHQGPLFSQAARRVA